MLVVAVGEGVLVVAVGADVLVVIFVVGLLIGMVSLIQFKYDETRV